MHEEPRNNSFLTPAACAPRVTLSAPAAGGGSKNPGVGFRAREPFVGLPLVGEIERGVIGGENLAVFARQAAHDCRARHAGVPRAVDALAGKIEQQRRAHANLPSVYSRY